MALPVTEDGSHFYAPDGSPVYGIGLTDAKRIGAVPSPSECMRTWAKPGLERYKLEQLLLAALTLPQQENEPLELYAERVMQDANEHRDHAVTIGRTMHAIIENWVNTGFLVLEAIAAEYRPALQKVATWLEEHFTELSSEETFANPRWGFGGKRDLRGVMQNGTMALLDLKTQYVRDENVNKNGSPKFTFYREWAIQLAAYRLDTPVGLDACASVAISTNPNLPDFKVKWWPDTHARYMNMETATALWLNILDNWYLLHNFPRTAALEARSTVEPAMN